MTFMYGTSLRQLAPDEVLSIDAFDGVKLHQIQHLIKLRLVKLFDGEDAEELFNLPRPQTPPNDLFERIQQLKFNKGDFE